MSQSGWAHGTGRHGSRSTDMVVNTGLSYQCPPQPPLLVECQWHWRHSCEGRSRYRPHSPAWNQSALAISAKNTIHLLDIVNPYSISPILWIGESKDLMIPVPEPRYVPYLFRSIARPIQGNGHPIGTIDSYEQRRSIIPILTINFDSSSLKSRVDLLGESATKIGTDPEIV